MVLEKTLESPLDCKEIQSLHSKGDQSWVIIGRTDTEAETPILWPPDVKKKRNSKVFVCIFTSNKTKLVKIKLKDAYSLEGKL